MELDHPRAYGCALGWFLSDRKDKKNFLSDKKRDHKGHTSLISTGTFLLCCVFVRKTQHNDAY